MISLSSGPLSTYPHQCVMMTYFEVVVRYAKSIPPPSSQPQYLFSFLSAFMDARGLRNPLPSVRARAASCFRNFVRSLKALLFPYLDTIVGLLQDMLVISFEVQKSVPFEDQLNFYESLGLIVGACPDMATQRKHAEALMQPTVSQLEEILVKELYKNDLVSDKPYYTTMLSQLINVIGTFSKGFYAISKDGNPPSPRSNGKQAHAQPPTPTPAPAPAPPTPLAPSRMIFVRALDLVLRIPVVLPAHEALRETTFFFLHRMIDVLGPAILPALPSTLALLLTNSLRTKDVLEFIVLVNQIVSRFKEGVFALINEMLMPFLRRMFELLNPATPPSENSEEQREWMELQKSYYVFLQCVLTNNLAGIFTSPANVPHFTQILGTVMQGLKSKYPYFLSHGSRIRHNNFYLEQRSHHSKSMRRGTAPHGGRMGRQPDVPLFSFRAHRSATFRNSVFPNLRHERRGDECSRWRNRSPTKTYSHQDRTAIFVIFSTGLLTHPATS